MSEASDTAVPLSRSPVGETPGHPASCRERADTVDLKALARLVLARDARRDSNEDGVSRGPRTRETPARQSVSASRRPGHSETVGETVAHFTPSDSLENQSLAGVSLSPVSGSETTETGRQSPISVETVAKDGDDNVTRPAPSWTEAEEERAAIVEHDGKIPREWAEGFARLDPDQPPANVPLKRWQRFIDDVGRFLDSPFCAVAAALGWGSHDLFGADRDRPFARIDRAGLLWLLNGDKVLMLAQDAVTIETRTGARQTYRCKPPDPGRVLAWELTQ
jgi:hypothetical protein